jgi:D-glycero-alpha-D-manno-heptose-7-phosphate kinase
MLIARSPLRVSLFGGGTDLPAYYTRYGGAVLSTTLDKYVYVVLNANEDGALQITSSDYRMFYRLPIGEPLMWDGDLSLPRAVLQHFGVEQGVSMFLASQVPPGTGLGSSSAVTVALIKAISTACGLKLSKGQVAEMACYIELVKLEKPIGIQDQYASAWGGFNWISFDANGVCTEPLSVPQEVISRLEHNLLMMFTGATHDSAHILKEQTKSSKDQSPKVIESLQAVHELALSARKYLARGDLDRFGDMFDQAWQHKKRFAPGVSNERIDKAYTIARNNGARGGKIAGAGGGGFMVLYCEDGTKDRVEAALAQEGLKRMDFHFESDGARVLSNAGVRLSESEREVQPYERGAFKSKS